MKTTKGKKAIKNGEKSYWKTLDKEMRSEPIHDTADFYLPDLYNNLTPIIQAQIKINY